MTKIKKQICDLSVLMFRFVVGVCVILQGK